MKMKKFAIAYRDCDSAVKYVIGCDGKWWYTTDEARRDGYAVLYR